MNFALKSKTDCTDSILEDKQDNVVVNERMTGFHFKKCGLSPEMGRLEVKIKRIALPIAILVMTIYLMACATWENFTTALAEATIGVWVVWLLDRQIILAVKEHFRNKKHATRLLVQFSLTITFSLVLEMALFFSHLEFFGKDKSPGDTMLYLKNLMTNLFLFTLIVNGIYEIIFLFEKLHKERLEKEEYKKAVIETRLENLRSQVNPHFLFNTFNALSELILENPQRASDIVVELSDVYRYVLQSREKNWELLSKEIQVTKSYIEIVKIRYEENVQISLNIDSCYNNWYIPPMALQMLIENAIKHNEISSRKPLHVDIFTEREALVVQNNYQPRVNAENSNGVGLKNIESRYTYLLNKSLEINSNEQFFSVKLPLIKIIS